MSAERANGEPRNPITPVPHPDTSGILELAREGGFLQMLDMRTRVLVEDYYWNGVALRDLRRYSGKKGSGTGDMILAGVRLLAEYMGLDTENLHITLKSTVYSREAQERARQASLGNIPVNKGQRKP